MSSASMPSSSMPKILVVSRTFFPKEGGIEEYVYNRCLQDPQQVILLTAAQPGDRAWDASQAFPIHRWFQVHWRFLGSLNSLLKQLINLVCVPVMAFQLYHQERYQAIEWGHGYDFPALLLLSYLLPVKCFLYLHGNDLLCPLKNPFFKAGFQWMLFRCDGIVCNSQFTKDYLHQHFTVATPTYVINPAVRPSKFGLVAGETVSPEICRSLRQRYHIPETALVILSVGRLVPRKGFDRVIVALPSLLATGLDVHYLICGRGRIQADLQALAQEIGMADRVHFAGFVSDQELAHYYATCDLFSLLTYFDHKNASIEGFGIVYVEASYFGKPVLASRIGGVADAVKHGETGWLVNPESGREINQALLTLCQDQALREQLGQQGRQRAVNPTLHRILYQPQEVVYTYAGH